MLDITTRRALVAIFSLLGLFALIGLFIAALQNTIFVIVVMFIFAYILIPLIHRIEAKLKIKRWLLSAIISLIVFLIITLLPVFILPMLIDQIKEIIVHLPNITTLINQNVLATVNQKFGTSLMIHPHLLKETLFPKTATAKVLNLEAVMPIARGGLSIISTIIDLILAPLMLFYILKYWEQILSFMDKLIPQRYTKSTRDLFIDIDHSLSYYLRGQIMVMIIMAFIYGIAFNAISLPAGTTIGAVTGLLVFIPYVGLLSGTALALLMALSKFTGMTQIIQILVIIGVGNLVENLILTPLLIGNSMGLNPILVILALIICGNLFGIVGILAALPITAISVVLLKHIIAAYLQSGYYLKKKNT